MSFLLWFRKAEGKSANTANERLQRLVAHDRAGISPGKIDALKEEMIKVISKHFTIETNSVRLKLTRERDQHKLIADIPLAPQKKPRR
jgi:cell division topological specificity factor